MARRPSWTPAADAAADLEMELDHLRVVAEMLRETSAEAEPERADYLGERVLEHVGRANAAFRVMHRTWSAPKPVVEVIPPSPPMTREAKAALVRRLTAAL